MSIKYTQPFAVSQEGGQDVEKYVMKVILIILNRNVMLAWHEHVHVGS